MSIERYNFDITDLKIATRTGEATWGTALDVAAISQLQLSLVVVNKQLRGDGGVADTHTRITHVRARIRFGFKGLDVPGAITGKTPESSGNDRALTINKGNVPYIAICGRVEHTADGGDSQLFIPKCKLVGDFVYNAQEGEYVTPELEFEGIEENATYGAAKFFDHATAVAVAIPPTWGA